MHKTQGFCQTTNHKVDPENIRAVVEWPIPANRKELQRFLGFANFYCRFVRDYSKIASPLLKLTSVNVSFNWPSEADKAFMKLKTLSSIALVLIQPVPFIPANFLPPRLTTMWGTVNYWQSSWLWRIAGGG